MTHSHDPSRGHIVDRRSEPRMAAVFRPVLIEFEDFAGFCLARNISSRGFSGSVYADLDPGTQISVRFGDSLLVDGEVQWAKDGQIGVQFRENISPSIILAAMASQSSPVGVSRAPRLPLCCEVDLVLEDRFIQGEMENISQRGMMLRAPFVRPGDRVGVVLPELEQRTAMVRWRQDRSVGLEFCSPLRLDALATWVLSLQKGHPEIRRAQQQ